MDTWETRFNPLPWKLLHLRETSTVDTHPPPAASTIDAACVSSPRADSFRGQRRWEGPCSSPVLISQSGHPATDPGQGLDRSPSNSGRGERWQKAPLPAWEHVVAPLVGVEDPMATISGASPPALFYSLTFYYILLCAFIVTSYFWSGHTMM